MQSPTNSLQLLKRFCNGQTQNFNALSHNLFCKYLYHFSHILRYAEYTSNKTVSKIIPECRSSNQTDNEEKIRKLFFIPILQENHKFSHSLIWRGQEIASFFIDFFSLLVCSAVWKESFRLTQNSFVIIGKLKRIWTSVEGSFISYFMCAVREKNQQRQIVSIWPKQASWSEDQQHFWHSVFACVCVFFLGAKVCSCLERNSWRQLAFVYDDSFLSCQ